MEAFRGSFEQTVELFVKAGRQQREVVRWGYGRVADLRASATDPDVSPMQHKKKGAIRLGYLTRYVVDGGKAHP